MSNSYLSTKAKLLKTKTMRIRLVRKIKIKKKGQPPLPQRKILINNPTKERIQKKNQRKRIIMLRMEIT